METAILGALETVKAAREAKGIGIDVKLGTMKGVIHGDADRILPITASCLRTAKLIKGSRLSVVKDGPHCITWTHADEVNSELVNFLGKGIGQRSVSAGQTEAVA